MRSFLTWLLVFGVLAGVAMRGTADARIVISHSHPHGHSHEKSPWHGDHHHGEHDHDHDEPASEDDSESSAPCGPGHHDHCVDVAPSPMIPLFSDGWKVMLSASLMFDRSLTDIRVPDGPYADLDSPPLI